MAGNLCDPAMRPHDKPKDLLTRDRGSWIEGKPEPHKSPSLRHPLYNKKPCQCTPKAIPMMLSGQTH